MVDFADAAIGNFTSALKDKKMWDQSIIVFSAVSTSQTRLGAVVSFGLCSLKCLASQPGWP